MANNRLYPFWSNLTTALHTGEPQNEARNGEPSLFKNSLRRSRDGCAPSSKP